VLATAPIPASLVTAFFQEADLLNREDAEERASLAFKQVTSASLAEIAGEKRDARAVHTLVSRTMRFEKKGSPERTQRLQAAAIVALWASFPSSIDDLAAPKIWPWSEQLLPHIFAATAYAEEANVAGATTAELLMHLGSYLQHRGEYAEAHNLFDRALILAEARGPNDLQIAHLLNAIGYLLRAQGHPADAQAKHERALKIIKAKLPADDAEVGRTLNSLGRALFDQRNLTGALDNLKRALAITKVALSPDHPEIASILNNMGRVYYEQGDLTSARDAHEHALIIKERAFKPDHPSVATTLANLGRVLLAQRDVKGAQEKLDRARKIQETALGEDHPDLADTLKILADVLEAEARTLRERARSISDALLRPSRRFRLQSD
jgi:tetratricopeptide (TPR) repeat protein